MNKLYILGLLFIISNAVFAQSGKITGKVIDASSSSVLAGATLILIEKSKTAIADQNGDFTFSKLEPGSYSIKSSYSGYKEKIIDEIFVKNDDNTAITISLELRKNLDTVMLSTTPRVSAKRETIVALLGLQKNMSNTMDFVSAESLKRTPAKTAGDAIKMVSGASIQDERFAVIRGLNDRYNAAFINGAPLPSTESDRKAFAFDIFPSAILDNLVIYKTATPDKTGEFAGGIIDITTKSILPKSFTSIAYGFGFNSLLAGNPRYFSENIGKKDWIGIDDGTRAIPSGIPSLKGLKYVFTPDEKGDFAKLIGNYKWGIKKAIARPNYNFQLSKGFNIERNQKEFIGTLFSLNYNRTYTFNEGERNGYEADLDTISNPKLVHRGKFKDSVYNDEVVVALLANVAVKINNSNNISWKNNFSINTDNKLVKRLGAPDITDDPNTFVKETVRWFTSNQIFSSQLAGEHTVGKQKTRINWLGAYSKVDREIPNLARSSYTTDPNVTFLSAGFNTTPLQTVGHSMFFSSSNENIKSIKADITQPYKFMKNAQNSVKLGGGYQVRKRDFTSRTLGFGGDVRIPQSSLAPSFSELPEDQIFLSQHLGKLKDGTYGFVLNDGTPANSDYSASSITTHAYIMNDQRFFKKFRLIYGVRLECFNQKLNALKDARDTINFSSTVTDFLPSVNFVYAVTPKMNVRLSYAETINRPEFRELAPFLFLDYVTSYVYEGTNSLKRAKIKNYDFRYEFFPGKAQVFSVSAFYKDFTNPIEIATLPNTSNQTKYINTTSANVYGLEAEFRTLISTLFGMKREDGLLSKLTLSANAAYMKSTIELKDSLFGFSPEQLFGDRALQGQSPYIINGSFGYNNEKTGFSSTLLVNRVGDRILIAGTRSGFSNNADIYEKARTIMDFQLAKSFLKNTLEVKFTAKDILAQDINFYFDFDKSKSFNDKDRFLSSYRAPKVFNISISLKL
jgi:outer membrane receptor protein involved in Fe transport